VSKVLLLLMCRWYDVVRVVAIRFVRYCRIQQDMESTPDGELAGLLEFLSIK
jgi:hypothetical protein